MATIGKLTVNTKEIDVEWRIPNFSSLTSKCYRSQDFYFAKSSWHLSIFPNGDTQKSTRFIRLYLVKRTTDFTGDLVYTLGLKASNGAKYGERHYTHFFRKEIVGWGSNFLSRSQLLEKKSELLPSDVLTVTLFCTAAGKNSSGDASEVATAQCSYCKETLDSVDISSHEKKCLIKPIKCPECSEVVALKNWYEHHCKVTGAKGGLETTRCTYCKETLDSEDVSSHEEKCVNKPIKCPGCSEIVALKNWYEHHCHRTVAKGEPCISEASVFPHDNKILHDLKEFFLKKENCDVIITVKGQEFPAHKAILEARSSALAANFRTNMKEKQNNTLEIKDCEPSCFSDFLCFIYYGDIGVISQENVFNLFTLADKYFVEGLRSKCLLFMKENLSVDTFCDTLTLALLHSERDLIKLATDFFIKNAPDIILTVKWQEFLAENPTHTNELLVKLLRPDASSNK